jgi:serine/threonine-protein kinase
MTPTLLNNRYRVLQNLGAGGFGHTFLAEDTHMPSGRRCVIKQLKPVTHDPQTYKLVQDRFQREAAVLEDLGEGSNQIPNLYAYFSEAGQFYLVQEYIDGDTLTKRVEQRGRLPENEVEQILVSLLPVLDYVHSRHIVHRDIKPDNIIIRKRDGLPVLIDFGAVKEAMNTVVSPNNSAPSMVIGTPGFMPAEQAKGRPTFASDLYGLGLTAVFLLTGKMPQELQADDRTGEIVWRQYAPNINPNLAMVLDRAIRFAVRDRFVTAKDMLNALQSSAAGAPSDMATAVVSPGNSPHAPHPPTPPIANPYPPQTVPAGTNPVIRRNDRNPFLIGALIVGGVLLAAIAIASGLRRTPEAVDTASSNSEPTSEQRTSSEPTSEQRTSQFPSDSVPSPSPTQPTDSEPISKPRTSQPFPDSTQPRSRTQPTDSEPTSEPRTSEPSPSPRRSRSRSQPSETTPPPVLPESPSDRSTQQPSPTATQAPSPRRGNDNQNSNQASNIPAFAPGTQESYIREELGRPTKVSSGYWNTRALLYENYVPGQVSLGYLYDPGSGRLRQSEASFSDSVAIGTMSGTLNKMLNRNASGNIQQGLEDVYQGKSDRYTFTGGRDNSLKGVIERNKQGRVYIAVWEADLHD